MIGPKYLNELTEEEKQKCHKYRTGPHSGGFSPCKKLSDAYVRGDIQYDFSRGPCSNRLIVRSINQKGEPDVRLIDTCPFCNVDL